MKLALLICISLLPLFSYSQSDSLDFYFDDGGLSNTKNILKVDATGWIGGDYTAHYERVLASRFSLEVGAGLWQGGNLIEHPYNLDKKAPFNRTLTFQARGKIYFPSIYSRSAPSGMYNAILYRYRFAEFPESATYFKAGFHDVIFQSGYQHFLLRRLVLDIYAGFGVSLRVLNYSSTVSSADNDQILLFNLGLKIGYRL